MENAEINNIIKIVGLQYKKSYDDPESLRTLRYGRIMIMTDQVTFLWSAHSCSVTKSCFTSNSYIFDYVPGSRWLPHQRSSYQLLPPQLAITTETHIPGGVYHAHCQGERHTHSLTHSVLYIPILIHVITSYNKVQYMLVRLSYMAQII